MHIDGLHEFKRLLQSQQEKIVKAVNLGLAAGALRLQRESQKRVPVDSSNLKTNVETRNVGTQKTPQHLVAFMTPYAYWVHEKKEMKWKGLPRKDQKRDGKIIRKGKGKYWDPQGKAQTKFLSGPAAQFEKDIEQVVLDKARAYLRK